MLRIPAFLALLVLTLPLCVTFSKSIDTAADSLGSAGTRSGS